MELANEKTVKWALAIVVVFGFVFTMTYLQMVPVLKTFLVLTSVVLIGCILLQAGKGGGLAAIGGLQDQSSFGTRSSTFLGKLTYLIGAVFIVSTICLTKISSITVVEKATVAPTSGMPVGHPPVELPPGHPPAEGLPPGHPPAEGLPPGHPSAPGAAPAATPGEEKPSSAALGWQEVAAEKEAQGKPGPKEKEQTESPEK